MHKLTRSQDAAPCCLDEYDYNIKKWSDLCAVCKIELKKQLVLMQKVEFSNYGDYVRCAYCEGLIFNGGHIEHFRRKNSKHYPNLTFDWNNLFYVCGSTKHCGHYKDRRSAASYDPDHIIKPDVDDPDDYLYFHSNGDVRVRADIEAGSVDDRKAKETIRVLHLTEQTLVAKRRDAVKPYRDLLVDDLDEIMSWPIQDARDYIFGELEKVKAEPFYTAIKHFLLKDW